MKKSGFTLLEVLIALVILTGGIMLLANSWSGNLFRIRKAGIYNNVGTLLERKIVELEAQYKDKPLTEVPETDSGDFGDDFPEYSWEMKSRDLKFPDLSAVIIGQEDGQRDENLISMIRQMTEILSKAIKEVQVTVTVKKNKKELKYSATNYIVDYNTALSSVPGGAGAPPAGGK
jgi:general secretion pathway protein I